LKDGAPSQVRRIVVDLPLIDSTPAITGVCDGSTWEPNRLDLARGDVLSVWAAGLPENADTNNVRAAVNGERCQVIFLEEAKADGTPRQMNVRVPAQLRSGAVQVLIQAGATGRSAIASITIV
jgi:uncharacterized protein (TIGR03437 family)